MKRGSGEAWSSCGFATRSSALEVGKHFAEQAVEQRFQRRWHRVVGKEFARWWLIAVHPLDPCREMSARRDQVTRRPGVAAQMAIQRAHQTEVAQRRPAAEQERMLGEMTIERIELQLGPAVEHGVLLGDDAGVREVAGHVSPHLGGGLLLQPARPAGQQIVGDILLEERPVLVVMAPARDQAGRQPELVAPQLEQVRGKPLHRRRRQYRRLGEARLEPVDDLAAVLQPFAFRRVQHGDGDHARLAAQGPVIAEQIGRHLDVRNALEPQVAPHLAGVVGHLPAVKREGRGQCLFRVDGTAPIALSRRTPRRAPDTQAFCPGSRRCAPLSRGREPPREHNAPRGAHRYNRSTDGHRLAQAPRRNGRRIRRDRARHGQCGHSP